MAKRPLAALMVILVCGCGNQDEPPPAPNTDYSGVLEEQVNALDKAREVGDEAQRAQDAQRRQLEQSNP